jgi:hypothetical protein
MAGGFAGLGEEGFAMTTGPAAVAVIMALLIA